MDRESIESEIRALPTLLRAALERRMRCTQRVAQLKDQLSALEDAQDEDEDAEESWGVRGKVARARLALDEAQAQADLRVRQTLEGRVTEARVRAQVLADPQVQRLRRELIALEEEMRSGTGRRPLPAHSSEERALQEQLAAAEQEAELAEIDAQVAEAKMELVVIIAARTVRRELMP